EWVHVQLHQQKGMISLSPPTICNSAREGIALAKQRGAYRGRKKSLSSERIAELRQRVEAGEQKTKLAREFGISRETLYQYLRTDQ
ncbi:helix-turn-helix domain-containing protein, partial [Escherichia coli]|uniref:helix-turn-helix domain-containing protein n=1 Tax=Escherichia coli TaxID=562 RepID=UPI001FF19549